MNTNKESDIFFRMNFFILEAMYVQLIDNINIKYENACLTKKDKERVFYRAIMRSNRTDYSKYKNGSCEKNKITSTMEKGVLVECPELRKYLEGKDLLCTGNISGKWAREIINNKPSEIMQECLKEVSTLAKNVVIHYKDFGENKNADTPDKVCLWMCQYIIDNWVETRGSEVKVEKALIELEKIKVTDIDRCSTKALGDFYGRVGAIYNNFKTIYDYKQLVKK